MYKQEVLAAKQRVIEKVNFMATRLKEKQEVLYQFAVKFWDRQRLELEQKKRSRIITINAVIITFRK